MGKSVTDHPYMLGGGLLLLSMPIHFFVAHDISVGIAAVTLGIIGGAYFGFSVVDGRAHAMAVELVGAGVYGGAAIVGLLWAPLAIPIGIMLHALWDIAHHNNHFGATTPQWYIPACVIFDIPAGLILLWLWI